MYFVLRFDSDGIRSAEPDPRPLAQDVNFEGGIKLGPLPPIEFETSATDRGELLDYFPANARTDLLISKRFRGALDGAGVRNIDYYPARILEGRSGTWREDYFVANLIGVIQCVDRDTSVYTPMEGVPDGILFFDELRLDYSRVGDAKIFRLKEFLPLVIVHQSVRDSLLAAQLRGVSLLPTEGYSQ